MPCARCDADNPAGARFCSACGAPLQAACPSCGAALPGRPALLQRLRPRTRRAPRRRPWMPGERRHATVMFSDLTGYTALNEATDPEEVEAIMGRIKDEATAVIERHGGTVNQFVGDEIMALFGVPLARRDDPRRAVAAALELHAAVGRLITDLGPAPGRPGLSMHTGINTGLVVARRSDARAGTYALTGDAVNTAARLRSLAGPGEVLVSADTWQQVADHFEADAGAPVEVKGKERPLSPYRIRGDAGGTGGGRRPARRPGRGAARLRRRGRGLRRTAAQPGRRRPRRSRGRQVAARRRVRSPGADARLLLPRRRRARLRRGDRPRRDPQPGAQPARRRRHGRAGRAPGSDRARRRGPDDRRRPPVVPLRPARRDAAARAARARRGDEHRGPRAGVAARRVRAGDDGRERPRRSS